MRKASTLIMLVGAFMLVGVMVVPMGAKAAVTVDREQGLGQLFLLDKLFSKGTDSRFLSSGKTDLGDLFMLDRLFPAQPATAAVVSLATQLRGRILLQTEENGEAWYVNPASRERVFLNGPAQAFNVMSASALGISNEDFADLSDNVPSHVRGRFLIKTEDAGKLYYVNPVDNKLTFVGGPAGAHALIMNVGLGISNSDLDRIPAAE